MRERIHHGDAEEEERRADILVRRRMTDRNVYPPLVSAPPCLRGESLASVVNP